MLSLRSLFTAKAALLALALLGAPAQAQNSICPDVAGGDSSNRCANTRFVQTQIAAGLPLANTFVYVGNASNIATGVAISGDCTITNLGILTCTKLNGVSPGTLFPLNAAPAGTLTGATLNGTVTASSLTSVGTLTGGATGTGFTVNLSTSTISGALPAANFPALTGDITTPGGSLATTLATVNANVGSFGGVNSIPSFTVNGKGLITAAAANVPAIPFTELTGQATYAQLPTASALAVLGRSANSSGVYADIQCTAAGGGVVKESSSTITCATLINANINAAAAIDYSKLASAGANTVLSNWTAGSAALVANTWPACASDGGHALTYTNGTGVLCTVIPSGGTVTSITPGGGLVSSTTVNCSQTAITNSGTLSGAGCPNAQVGTTYAIADSDRGKVITASNTAAQAYTIAQAATASNFFSGWFTEIRNIQPTTQPAAIVTITATTSTICGASTVKIYPGQSLKIVSDGTNYQCPGQQGTHGDWILLNTLTASNSATLSDTTSITAFFTEYEIVLEQILPATNSVSIQFQVQVSGTFQTTTYISSNVNGNGTTPTSSGLTSGILASNGGSPTNVAPGVNGRYLLSNPAQTLTCKMLYGDFVFNVGSAVVVGTSGGCYNGGSAAITGIQTLTTSGNITSGVMKIYGRL